MRLPSASPLPLPRLTAYLRHTTRASPQPRLLSLPHPRTLTSFTPTPTPKPTPPPNPTCQPPPRIPHDSLPPLPNATPLGLLRALDYVGTVSFAHTGCLLAATSGMDVFGATVVGVITAIGGGTLRDALILAQRPFWTEETEYMYLAIATGLLTFGFYPRENDKWRAGDTVGHFVADTLGVGAFCVIGVMNGVRMGMGGLVSVVCGVMTATFGGVVRDVLCRREVRILHSRAEIYATTAMMGGGGYWLALHGGLGLGARLGVGVGLACLARGVAWDRGVRLPVWVDAV